MTDAMKLVPGLVKLKRIAEVVAYHGKLVKLQRQCNPGHVWEACWQRPEAVRDVRHVQTSIGFVHEGKRNASDTW
ncbi:hypothetical protein WL93_02625 [Burkholderia diffusa]|uniref:hypothetical protein n=1 Tax=Burkholderia diffusa TaxID=488732 RepID=UPI00076BEA4D|nr:hypothetical protein [Burkholderia diffusa]KWF81063.1 hypothetical protein WL93_02625 [Burkholderia diffusa]